MKTSPNGMRSLFEPERVAVIGASADPSKIGHKILDNIIAGGYQGEIHPVNPRGGKILGCSVAKSIKDVEPGVDVVCVATPAKAVFDVVSECADQGAKNVILITSGFSEIGNIEEENRIAALAKERRVRLLGPNVFGIFSSRSRLNATFGPKNVLPGKLGIISQSGAIGIAMIGRTAAEKIGLSAIISVGNKCDIDEADLLEYLIDDPFTKVIMMYIEGVKDGVRFIEMVRRAAKVKPVVVIKSGWSQRGAVAAASHTGSLAGSDEIFDSLMRQCGVLRAETIQEAFDWSVYLADAPIPAGENCVIVTNGGGIGVMATDACEKCGVRLLDDLPLLEQTFGETVPAFGSVKNPVDLTGQADAGNYDRALERALGQDEIHSVISIFCETAVMDGPGLTRILAEKSRRFREKKPWVLSLFGGIALKSSEDELKDRGVPVYPDVYRAVSSLGALMFCHRFRERKREVYEDPDIDLERIGNVVEKARSEGRGFLLAREAAIVMQAIELPIPPSVVVKTEKEAIAFSEEKIGYPVVLKVVSRDILHKSDAGAVALDLDDREELIQAYQAILQNCRSFNPKVRIEGVEVSRMVPKGVETIIGARRDKTFGPIVMVGLGGIYVEVMKDVAFRGLPLSRREASEMVGAIRSYPLLLGVRGEKRKDIPVILDTIMKVGALIAKCRDITDVEVNPLMVYEQGEGCTAVDARILIARSRE